MIDRPSSLQALFAELKRRRLFRVMAVYGAVAFVLLQVADIAFEPLGLPGWTLTFVVVLAILGFPVAVVLAWAFEQTPEGIRRTEKAAPEEIEAIVAEPRSRRWPAGIAALVGIALLVGGAWWMGQRAGVSVAADRAGADGAGSIRSIAVLPLTTRTIGGAGDGEGSDAVLFADGMHDDLLTQLSRIGDLRVISRTSVEEFRHSEENIRDIAERLGTRYVVEGAVDRVGDRIRVNVQLIDANSDGHLWAETYDETMTLDNLFAIRDDLTRRIASSLRANLTPETEERLVRRPTEDAEAFELYTRARHLHDRASRPDLERAIELYERATELDPDFAAAYAGLALAHFRYVIYGFGTPTDRFPAARAALERALDVDPENAEALVVRAGLAVQRGDAAQSRRDLEHAIDLNPSHALARMALSRLLGGLGYERQALAEAEIARELDPLSAVVADAYAVALAEVGRPQEALEVAVATLELHPNFEPAAGAVAEMLQNLGRNEEAAATLRQALRRDPESIFANEQLAFQLLATGDRMEALQQIDRAVALTPDDYPTHRSRGRLLMDAGQFDAAVAALRQAVRLAPRLPRERAVLAMGLLAVGDTAAARAQLDTARTLTRDDYIPGLLIEASFRAGMVEDAVALSEEQAARNPESVEDRVDHAEFLLRSAAWAAHRPGAAFEVFEEARELSPDDDDLLEDYGAALQVLGRTNESLEYRRRLAAQRPSDPRAQMVLGWELLQGQRDVAGAGRAFRRALELRPGYEAALWGLARVHAREGRADSALAAMRRAVEGCGWPMCRPYHEVREAWLHALLDQPDAREMVARFEARADHLDYVEWLPVLAAAHGEFGDIDHAFDLLDRAYERRSSELLELRTEPWFDPLRDDPRFDALLKRMELD